MGRAQGKGLVLGADILVVTWCFPGGGDPTTRQGAPLRNIEGEAGPGGKARQRHTVRGALWAPHLCARTQSAFSSGPLKGTLPLCGPIPGPGTADGASSSLLRCALLQGALGDPCTTRLRPRGAFLLLPHL